MQDDEKPKDTILKTRVLCDQTAQDIALAFFSGLNTSEFADSTNNATRTGTNFQMLPIKYNNEIVFWIANNTNNNGYAIIHADKTSFPIEAFSTEGNFNYEALTPAEKEEFDLKLQVKYEMMAQNNIDDIEWATKVGETKAQRESDTTYIVDYEFYTPDSTKIIPKSGRKNPLGFATVWPRLYRPREWTIYWPYDYDMQPGYGDPYVSDNEAIPLNSMTVAVALYLDCSNWMNTKEWAASPSKISVPQSNWLTRYLAKLNDDLGVYHDITNNFLPAENLYKIPGSLSAYHGTRVAGPYKYAGDFQSVVELRNKLIDGFFILYQPYVQRNLQGSLHSAYLIDGYHEMRVKVTVKTYFCGILIKKKVYYEYRDFFYFVNGTAAARREWEQHDSKKKKNLDDYYYLLEPAYD